VSYAYNPTTDRLQSITRNNTTYTLNYDTFGRVTSTKVGKQTLASYTYGAANGDLLSTTYGNGAQVNYTYDALQRLITRTVGGNALTTNYRYLGAAQKLPKPKTPAPAASRAPGGVHQPVGAPAWLHQTGSSKHPSESRA